MSLNGVFVLLFALLGVLFTEHASGKHVSRSRLHNPPPRDNHVVPRKDRRQSSSCVPAEPQNNVTERLNNLLANGGPNFILSLCPSTAYTITDTLSFASAGQEISTQGYPTADERAMIVVNGTVVNGTGQATAINGQCGGCSFAKVRNVQVNGNRNGAPEQGGGLLEMGGTSINGQIVEFSHLFDPRGFSCLHFIEGSGLTCTNSTAQFNDIGPSGSDLNGQWADGISLSCANSNVHGNVITDATDGALVIFGSPGSTISNNTIITKTQTLLGAINMVDFDPWNGNFNGTVVENNHIIGPFADGPALTAGDLTGPNSKDIIIKVGMAIGPRIWFGASFGTSFNTGGTVRNNTLHGAMAFGIAVSGAVDWTIQDNVVQPNASFIGVNGPLCSSSQTLPSESPFIYEQDTTISSTLQSDFVSIIDGDFLICVVAPPEGDFWPFDGPSPSPVMTAAHTPTTTTKISSSSFSTSPTSTMSSRFSTSTTTTASTSSKKSTTSSTSSTVLIGALPPTSPSGPPGQTIHPGKSNGLCLTAASDTDGAAVNVQECAVGGSPSQTWNYTGGKLFIFSGTKCLDVTNGSTANGVKMQIFTCFPGNTNQEFSVTTDDRITWTNMGDCLDLTDGLTTAGNPVQMWKCTANDTNQVWNFS